MAFFDFIDDRVVFLPARFVDPVVRVLSCHRSIRWDHRHIQLVDVVELVCFGLGRSGHTRKLLIKTEIILNSDRGQRLSFAIDLHSLFRLDRLMQSVTPAAPRHFAAGEFVYDHHFVFFDDVLNVFFKQTIGAEELRNIVNPLCLRVAMLLPLRLRFLAFLITESLIEVDLGELADQIRQHERVRIIRVHEGSALLR